MKWNLGKYVLIWQEAWHYYLELFKWREYCRLSFYNGWIAKSIADVLDWFIDQIDLPVGDIEIRDFAWKTLKVQNDNKTLTMMGLSPHGKEVVVSYALQSIDERVKHGLATLFLCDHTSWFCILDTPSTPPQRLL